MRLEEMTWPEVERYLHDRKSVILPIGSVEQHGPIGLIGTDAICAREIAWRAGAQSKTIVAPEIAYAPAPFNMSFPGTVSVSPDVFLNLVCDVVTALGHHGFERIYVLNGHGANLEPLKQVTELVPVTMRIRSWWDFEAVNKIRQDLYGDWEGMHATPSEVAITQFTHRIVSVPDLGPPEKLSATYISDHSGDRHGPPDAHRDSFPDGRVGSHSSLARPAHGTLLLDAASRAVAQDVAQFAE